MTLHFNLFEKVNKADLSIECESVSHNPVMLVCRLFSIVTLFCVLDICIIFLILFKARFHCLVAKKASSFPSESSSQPHDQSGPAIIEARPLC